VIRPPPSCTLFPYTTLFRSFHVTWGTAPGVLEPFVRRVREGVQLGVVTLRFRHRVTALSMKGGVVDGVQGEVLEPSFVERGVPRDRKSTRLNSSHLVISYAV